MCRVLGCQPRNLKAGGSARVAIEPPAPDAEPRRPEPLLRRTSAPRPALLPIKSAAWTISAGFPSPPRTTCGPGAGRCSPCPDGDRAAARLFGHHRPGHGDLLHPRDIETWADLVARSMYMTGVRPGDVFQNMMGYGLFTGGLGFHYGGERLGALTIPGRRRQQRPAAPAHAAVRQHRHPHHPQLRPLSA